MAKTSQVAQQMWDTHHHIWRDPAGVASLQLTFQPIDQKLFQFRTYGQWWETLAKLKKTLVVGREYEHFLLSLSVQNDKPLQTYFPLPHPSGIAFDASTNHLYVASTRNPNMVFTFAPVKKYHAAKKSTPKELPLLYPVRSTFFPGSTYFHDLSLINGELYANAVAHNAIVKLDLQGKFEYVWWPKAIEDKKGVHHEKNYIQLNSIAGGNSIQESFFSASSDSMGRLRPGHLNYPVDGRGVIFSGKTRQPIARGLTRPHSARLHKNKVWVDNSGYGEVGFIDDEKLSVVQRIHGWTRGLVIQNNIAFFGTSRVIPKYRKYAPGVDVEKSICGVHALDLKTGEILGGITWPYGNQIFALELLPSQVAAGFPLKVGRQSTKEIINNFYSFLY